MGNSKDLFDDQVMTFGEHLDVLRVHLIKAIFGLIICVIAALFYGDSIVGIVRAPIDAALLRHGMEPGDVTDDMEKSFIDAFADWWNGTDNEKKESKSKNAKNSKDDTQSGGFDSTDSNSNDGQKNDSQSSDESNGSEDTTKNSDDKRVGADEPKTDDEEAKEIRERQTITVEFNPSELANALHNHNDKYPEIKADPNEQPIKIRITAPEFSQLKTVVKRQNQAVTLTVQEAFLTYLKVAFVAGLAIASPWVFFQIWQFVAVGLYPHERRYVYIYLPMSIGLFAAGAVFCFLGVFPFVLDFLLGFNKMLDVQPQIRLSEWISFAIMLPMMFGISFQLPLVMLFLERISVFEVSGYREKRRMAILVIAFLSMMLTPADPMSMLMMMFPLIILYELGIILCAIKPSKAGFPDEPQAA